MLIHILLRRNSDAGGWSGAVESLWCLQHTRIGFMSGRLMGGGRIAVDIIDETGGRSICSAGSARDWQLSKTHQRGQVKHSTVRSTETVFTGTRYRKRVSTVVGIGYLGRVWVIGTEV